MPTIVNVQCRDPKSPFRNIDNWDVKIWITACLEFNHDPDAVIIQVTPFSRLHHHPIGPESRDIFTKTRLLAQGLLQKVHYVQDFLLIYCDQVRRLLHVENPFVLNV